MDWGGGECVLGVLEEARGVGGGCGGLGRGGFFFPPLGFFFSGELWGKLERVVGGVGGTVRGHMC